MRAGAWTFLVGQIILDHIVRFGSGCEAVVFSLLLLVVILCNMKGTFPGPGFLWS